ncbi:hypothetical protein GCM10022215_16530 [Nocardioides fonticola]|uniref:Thioredoxin domain-containing protein n=1 Tax=Nocardioides fonticola TaxID=450363 RepID=A0ABP7XHD8_9ACTN
MGPLPLALLALAGGVLGVVARLVLLPALGAVLAAVLPRRLVHEDDGGAVEPLEVPVDDLLGGPARPARDPRDRRELPGWVRDAVPAAAAAAVLAAGVLLAPRAADLLGLPPGALRVVGTIGAIALLLAVLRGRAATEPSVGVREGLVAGVLLVPVAAPLVRWADDGARLDDASVLAGTAALALGVLLGQLAGGRLPHLTTRSTTAALGVLAIVAAAALAAPAAELPRTTTPSAAPTADPEAPADPPLDAPLDQDAPGQTYELLQDSGQLTPFADRTNRSLSRCVPASDQLARCGQAPPLDVTGPWFNLRGNPAPTWDSLRGRIVLIDFTSSACLTCRDDRTHLAHWADDYAAAGLTVIAVHRPEYAVEADPEVPAALVRREGIDYPLVSDPDGRLFDAYRNRYWPSKYLVDATGTVRAIRFGGGGYAVVERQIRTLLRQARPGVRLAPPVDVIDVAATFSVGRTPTLRTRPGQSGYHGSPDYLSRDTTSYAVDISQPPDTFSLGGYWDVAQDGITARRDAELRLHYHANEVWQLLGGTGTVTLTRGDEPPRTIRISGVPRLYRLTRDAGFQDAVVTLRYSAGVSSYGFSFG